MLTLLTYAVTVEAAYQALTTDPMTAYQMMTSIHSQNLALAANKVVNEYTDSLAGFYGNAQANLA